MGIFYDAFVNKKINEIQSEINFLKNNNLSVGKLSDGYHTFNDLYHHRAVLFGVICSLLPKDKSWKSLKHHDGSMFDDMFIVGIDTEYGQITYHYDIDPYYDTIFAGVRELPNAPEWDGHTPDEAVERLVKLIQSGLINR